jgi:hypothetical protein
MRNGRKKVSPEKIQRVARYAKAGIHWQVDDSLSVRGCGIAA